jgi:hypothetical protein
MATFDQSTKDIINKYLRDLASWIDKNDLSKLPDFESLSVAKQVGPLYRRDQQFYELVTDQKTKLLGIKALLSSFSITAGRTEQAQVNSLLESVDSNIRTVDNIQAKARQRLKFYDNVFYVMGNPTYGDY